MEKKMKPKDDKHADCCPKSCKKVHKFCDWKGCAAIGKHFASDHVYVMGYHWMMCFKCRGDSAAKDHAKDCPRYVDGKIILDLCGGTGSWSKPYKDAGYDVRTITLPENDVRTYVPPERVWGVLAAPPCTEFSFAKHYHGKGNYTHDFAAGLAVADACLRIVRFTNPNWWALENPRGYLKRWYGEPKMTFDPWEFGDPYQKKTCLWGVFNDPDPKITDRPAHMLKFSLLKSKDIRPEVFGTFTRTERRAMTPAGFAKAFFEANP